MNKKELIYFITSFFKETLESEKNNYEEDYFFDQEEYDDFIDSIVCNLRGKLTKNNIENEWDGGADKEVIIFKDFDFVIKIPKVSETREIEIYNAAKAKGFQKYFAEVQKIFITPFYNKIFCVYIQKKINFCQREDNYWNKISKEDREKINVLYEEIEKYSVVLKDGTRSKIFKSSELAVFLFFLSSKKRENFINFLIEEKVNDLHNSNFIYSFKNKELIIFDYSGYDSSYLYEDEDDNYSSYNSYND